ncbi:MAG: EscU/YscU/HrcU family type III secretion system export apparatus switch protein [Candidatus Saganbacteria bacterium]|nr:EscU/YscU/HrcU family type III secretion system export apparatus switch protein [Candidatus Saganbacteria bacterium]
MAEKKEAGPEQKPDIELIPAEKKRTAVALRYDIEKDAAPLVLASGRGLVADEILRIAEENEIPLYENPRLADILSKLELDTQIPQEMYILVAEVLYFVYQLDRMAEKRQNLVKKIKDETKK